MQISDIEIEIDKTAKKLILKKKDGQRASAVLPEATTLQWCLERATALAKTLKWISEESTTAFADELNTYMLSEEHKAAMPAIKSLGEVLMTPEQAKSTEVPKQESPTTEKVQVNVDDFLNTLSQREQQMFNTVVSKYGKKPEELATFYLTEGKRMKVPHGLLIYRDWKTVGGEAIRRIVLMNENFRLFKFFTTADNYFPVNSCVRLVTNLKVPFTEGRIIGISNRTISMFFSDYMELVEGQILKRRIMEEPRIDSMIAIPATEDIYQKIPRAEDVLNPLAEQDTMSKVLEIAKQNNMPIEEVLLGELDAIYTSNNGQRQALHIGDSKIHPNRVTIWVETNRYNLTENDRHKIIRVYGYIQHMTSEYQNQIQDNLQINAYHLVIEG